MQAGAFMTESNSAQREGLLSALAGLDRVLAEALRIAPEVYGWEQGNPRFRGLYITPADADRMLSRDAGTSPFGELGAEPFFEVTQVPALSALAERCGLS